MRSALSTLLGLLVLGPAAPLHAEAVESSCVSCHAEEEDAELSAPVEEWRRSVHAEANVSCDGCHGGDPQQQDADLSMDEESAGFLGRPGRKQIISFCGGCHEQIAHGFQQSVMGLKSTEGERVATCTTCHMIHGHAIQHPNAHEILTEERCGECHEGARAVALRTALEHLDALIRSADARVAPIRGAIDTSPLDEELRQAHQHAVVVAHTYNLARIQLVAERSAERLGRLDAEADALEAEVTHRRRIGIGVITFFTIACAGTLRLSYNLRQRSPPHEPD